MKKYVILRILLIAVHTILHHELKETTANQGSPQRSHSAAFFHEQLLKLKVKNELSLVTRQ
jgi:hypothetical protein